MNEPVYNCGCFWWMHDTVNVCDLYLPDRKPAREECPLVTDCRERLARELEATKLAEQAAFARLLANMPECNREALYGNRTAMGRALLYEHYVRSGVEQLARDCFQ